MPTDIIINTSAIAIGSVLGTFAGRKLSEDFKEKLNMIFGVCAMGMGISSVVLMENMPAVIFAIILGTMSGLAVWLGDKINKAAGGNAEIDREIRKTGGMEYRK